MLLTRYSLTLLIMLTVFAGNLSAQTLTACGHHDYPPFTWYDGQQVKGYSVELIQKIGHAQNITIEPVYVGPWTRCLAEVASGNVDILLAAYKTDEREQFAVFFELPMANDNKSIFVWQGREFEFGHWDQLIGKRMARPMGVSFGIEFDQFIENNLTVYNVVDRKQYFRMLQNNRIDFFVTGQYLGQIQAHQYGYKGQVKPLGLAVTEGQLYFAISHNSVGTSVISQLNAQLSDLKADIDEETLLKTHLRQYLLSIKP